MPIVSTGTRKSIRQSIGRNTGLAIIGTASGNGSTSTLVDTYQLAKYDTDELKGRQLLATVTATGALEYTWITAHNSTTKTSTVSPLITSTTSAQVYEIWDKYRVEDIHDMINQGIKSAAYECLQEKADTSLTSVVETFEYAVPAGFVAIYGVEFTVTGTKYTPLPPEYWTLVKGATAYIHLTPDGNGLTQAYGLRVRGYSLPAALADETTASTIDPDYLTYLVTGQILLTNGDKADIGKYFMDLSAMKLKGIATKLDKNTLYL